MSVCVCVHVYASVVVMNYSGTVCFVNKFVICLKKGSNLEKRKQCVKITSYEIIVCDYMFLFMVCCFVCLFFSLFLFCFVFLSSVFLFLCGMTACSCTRVCIYVYTFFFGYVFFFTYLSHDNLVLVIWALPYSQTNFREISPGRNFPIHKM